MIDNMAESQYCGYILDAINETLRYSKRREFYKQRLREVSAFIELVKEKFFTYRRDILNNYSEFLDSDICKYGIVFRSSGTTGRSIFSFYSKKDIQLIDLLCHRVSSKIGINCGDVGLINIPMELIMPGYFMQRLLLVSGAMVIPAGSFMLSPKEVFKLLKKFEVSIYLGYLSSLMRIVEENENISDHNLRIAILGGEPISNKRRKILENLLDIDIYGSWGMSEVFWPLGSECKSKNGYHYMRDIIFIEVVNPQTRTPIDWKNKNVEGALVITTLKREGMPLLRYWTNDLVKIENSTCSCGEADHRIIIKDKLDFAIKVNDKLLNTYDLDEIILTENIWEYQVNISKGNPDSIKIKIVIEPFKDTIITSDEIYEIKHNFVDTFGIEPVITKVGWKKIRRPTLKRRRIFMYE